MQDIRTQLIQLRAAVGALDTSLDNADLEASIELLQGLVENLCTSFATIVTDTLGVTMLLSDKRELE